LIPDCEERRLCDMSQLIIRRGVGCVFDHVGRDVVRGETV
jgi:hypothetical protein